jgi:hypothetical protein
MTTLALSHLMNQMEQSARTIDSLVHGVSDAHDLLHARQLVRLHFTYTVQTVAPYGTRYAGEW